jgi:hypothetical protein
MSTDAVTALRERMIEDMNARKLCAGTQRGHIRGCKRFAAFLKRSPETAMAEDIRRFQLHLAEAGLSICNRNAVGAHSLLVEKAAEAAAGDVQCASGERCRQADVPRRLQAPSLHHSGERLLRVDHQGRWQAAVFHQRGRWRRVEFRGPVGAVEEPRDGPREPVTSCTIIVTAANALTRPIHDRMLVVLDKADIRSWLNGTAGTEVLKTAAEDRLSLWPVSRL